LNGKVAAPGLENRDYGRGDPLRCPRDTLYPLKLALTSPTGGSRSVGIVHLRTKATEFLTLSNKDIFYMCHKRKGISAYFYNMTRTMLEGGVVIKRAVTTRRYLNVKSNCD
jgi:hypothetical protein